MKPLFYQMELSFPCERVWEAWTTPEGLTSWLCERARVEPKVGGAYDLGWHPEESPEESETTNGRVVSIERPTRLQFSWRCPSEVAELFKEPAACATEVKVELVPTEHGTRLEVTHLGWEPHEDWQRARKRIDQLWTGALERLRVALLYSEIDEEVSMA